MVYGSQRVAIQPEQRADEKQARLGSLTGLRFLAALAVVLDYYWTAFIWWDPATGVPGSTPRFTGWMLILQGGGHGVDCFFVLSGFILAYTYVAPGGTLRASRASFWVARLARIYPVYLVGLALGGIPLLLFRSHHLASLLAAGGATPLLLKAWVPSLGTWNSWDPPDGRCLSRRSVTWSSPSS